MKTDVLETAVNAINIFVERTSSDVVRDTFLTHLDVLEKAKGTSEEKVRELAQYSQDEMSKVLEDSDHSENVMLTLVAHQATSGVTAELLRVLWEERVRADL